MNKFRPRNKICFQNNENIHANLKISKLNKKKWNLFKKRLKYKKSSPFCVNSFGNIGSPCFFACHPEPRICFVVFSSVFFGRPMINEEKIFYKDLGN